MASPLPKELERQSFDLIVIGAGINGAGIARDAALRGLRVCVVDQDDAGSATSSWNSRLIHGGLRYLEHGDLGLVRESLREREILLRTAPHLVRPLPLTLPIYDNSRRSKLRVRLGMLAYDLLSFDKSLPLHEMWDRARTSAELPGLAAEGLQGAALYHDAQIAFPERLVIENLLCARDHGAAVVTHTAVTRIVVDAVDNAVTGVELKSYASDETYQVRADTVVNVSGPWVDRVLATTGRTLGRRLGATQGSHIVVRPFPGAPGRALYAEATSDGRPFFTLPWNGLYLIGATDLRYDGDPAAAQPSAPEIDYLLSETNRLFPHAALNRTSILYSYAGVRPLPYSDSAPAGAISRRHQIVDHSGEVEGLWSIVGGKLTTYRRLAEETIDQIGRTKGWRLPRCPTRDQPLPGARTPDWSGFRKRFLDESGLDHAAAERLLSLYGVRAEHILERVAADPHLRRVFSPATGAMAAELVHAFDDEMAVTLTDALLRRTVVGLGPLAGLDAVDAAARAGERHLGWSRERAQQEAAAVRSYVDDTLLRARRLIPLALPASS